MSRIGGQQSGLKSRLLLTKLFSSPSASGGGTVETTFEFKPTGGWEVEPRTKGDFP